ncbi:MAG: precorrin-4 C(11)-methyltransferase [Blautia sp.]|nr:precorrin-4 C(11)-methyltransferase [Blautia sp.]
MTNARENSICNHTGDGSLCGNTPETICNHTGKHSGEDSLCGNTPEKNCNHTRNHSGDDSPCRNTPESIHRVHFVGAGPGAPDLITLRGLRLLEQADVVIYAGSLVNPALLGSVHEDCTIYNSAEMTLEQVIEVIHSAYAEGKDIVRLHTGDPCLYGAIREQMDRLGELGIPYDDTPGVSSFCGAAASLGEEYTLPGVSQSVIITRMAGRTPVPEREALASLAAHGASMVIFLSAGMLEEVQRALLAGAYTENTPAAIVYKATWPEEKLVRCTVGSLARCGKEHGIRQTALILAGDFLGRNYERSRLYDPGFSTGFRNAQRDTEDV